MHRPCFLVFTGKEYEVRNTEKRIANKEYGEPLHYLVHTDSILIPHAF
jgi:hypothetical protein